jgi:methionyl-tRNA synthetase
MDDLKITDAIAQVNELVNRANKYIDETEPWALAKDPEKRANLESVMVHLANSLYVAGMLMKPVLVTASDKLFDQLGVTGDLLNYDNIYKYGVVSNLKVEKKDQLFPRLDAAVEVEYIQSLMAGNK